MSRPRAVNVVPQADYCLLITFDNAEQRLFDVKPYFDFKPFAELKNLALFNTVKLGGLSIEWVHGQDICPDELYYSSLPYPKASNDSK
ncbi:MAG: DUF2442 domain-containing protein [Proteobacteria bacterium]|nr:DUF2442 domain-containing protein [Pseudomonadota bacterium]